MVKKKKNAVKTVKYIIINDFFNEEIIDEQKSTDFVDYVLNDIVWIDEDQQHYSKIMVLQKYYPSSIIPILNKRKTKYCQKNKISDMFLQIDEYSGYQIQNTCTKLYAVELSKYTEVKPLDYKTACCLELEGDIKKHTIKCELSSNNKRHVLITELDYILNYEEQKSNEMDINFVDDNNDNNNDHAEHIKKDSIILKLMNNFADNDDEQEQFSSKFSFGEYLDYWDYWEHGYENSVIPIYLTLKQELLNNRWATISIKQYYRLYRQCKKLLKNGANKIKAQDIGINNKKFNIPKGTVITINHLISLKLYTDFGKIQHQFKKHCRKYNANESMQDFIIRNSEIAHWCRYLKECCTFYGRTMDKEMTVYTGLSVKLLFDSMKTNFECPLSTTVDMNIANSFSEGVGVILKLQAANPKSRYFDVSWLSQFPHENERLFMGSSLKICDIYISTKTTKSYIFAIQMFEQIITGQFIDKIQTKTEYILYSLINFIMTSRNASDKNKTVFDSIKQYVENDATVPNIDSRAFIDLLEDEEYDTDDIKQDLEDYTCSNIAEKMTNQESVTVVRRYLDILNKRYIVALFRNIVERMIKMNRSNTLFINQYELKKIKCLGLFNLLVENNNFFNHFGINILKIKRVKQYEWMIGNAEYDQFKNTKPRQYIKSQPYKCDIDDNNEKKEQIEFHLECCSKYTEESQKVGLFLHLDVLPSDIEAIRIEYDLMCEKKIKYRHQMAPQWLSPYNNSGFKQHCGFQTFSTNNLNKNDGIRWIIGIKVIDKIHKDEHSDKYEERKDQNESDKATPENSMHHIQRFNKNNIPNLLINYEKNDDDENISTPVTPIEDVIANNKTPQSDNLVMITPAFYLNTSTHL